MIFENRMASHRSRIKVDIQSFGVLQLASDATAKPFLAYNFAYVSKVKLQFLMTEKNVSNNVCTYCQLYLNGVASKYRIVHKFLHSLESFR